MTGGRASAAAFMGVAALVLAAYANHFGNSFHFDDSHAVVDNVYIRDLHNVPLFFTDGRTSSALPANRTYRPVVTASLALDYRLGGGLKPLWFHVSTFLWFLAQLGLMALLYRATLDRARPEGPAWGARSNLWIAALAVALYGVHPAIAETINYVAQRADVYSTLGVVAGLAIYVRWPKLRATGLYLLPVALGILSKAPAAMFPVLLAAWLWFVDRQPPRRALLAATPSLGVAGACAWLVARMTPPTFVAGAASAYAYRISQPAVLMSYFRRFFLPLDLSADTDRVPVTSLLTVDGAGGLLFLAALAGAAWWCAKRRELSPVSFGIVWFLAASLPTSVFALAEVENDHRLYFPFVGLALAVAWTAALLVERWRLPRWAWAGACAAVLALGAWGTHERNGVWLTEETLWRDVAEKSPHNGRGLMNYGLSLMGRGRMSEALALFERARVFSPNYYVLEINLGIAHSSVGDGAEGESHFLRAIQLAPQDAGARYFYARWLTTVNRRREAIEQLAAAVQLNPDYIAAHHLLMDTYAAEGDRASLVNAATAARSRFPGDATADHWLAHANDLRQAGPAPVSPGNADEYIARSLAEFQAGKYAECIASAREALKIRPDYAEAWNNIGAAYNQLGQWDRGIEAEREALRLNPGLAIARNNLAWALSEKRKLDAARK
jgi:protein O-mannosyl-transferase